MANRKRMSIVVVIVALALGVVLAVRGRRPPKSVEPASADAASANAPNDVETPAVQASERAVVEPGQALIAPATGTPIRGLVVDVDGSPCAGVALEHQVKSHSALVAVSGDDGTFDTRLENFDGTLTTDGAWACVTPCRLDRERAQESHVLVVARAIAVSGRVVDARGRGVCQASVGVRIPVEVKGALPQSFSAAPDILAATASDATGHFKLPRIAFVPGGRLLASAHPLQPAAQALSASDQPLELVLGDPTDARLIEILVVDSAQQPLCAKVELGHSGGETGADGMLRFTVRQHELFLQEREVALIVCEPGYQPHFDDTFAALAFDGSPTPLFRRVVLVAPDLSIRGRVVDANGAPCSVGRVSLALDQADRRSGSCVEGSPSFPRDVDDFEIRGLREGEYVLECELVEPLVSFRTDPIRAGTSDVVLRVPDGALVPRVFGRVVTLDGGVVSRARLNLRLGAGARIPHFDPDAFFDNLSGTLFCDTAGGFELVDVPRQGAQLIVSHVSIATTVLDLASVDLTQELSVVALRRARLRLEGLQPTLSQLWIDLSDAKGARPWIRSDDGGVVEGMCKLGLRDGASETLEVAEGRYTLRAINGAGVLAPREIELVAGETLVVRP